MSSHKFHLSFLRRLQRTISVPLLIVLAVTVIILLPAYNIFYNSFTSLGFTSRSVGFTLVNYNKAFSDPLFWPLFFNSFVYALGSATFAILIATALAWIVVRTDTPLKRFSELVPIIPLVFPPVLKNIAWIYILAPRSGIANGFLSNLLGTPVNFFNAFSLPAMIWTFGLAEIPTAYLLIVPAFLMQDPSLEEASTTSGAGTFRTLFRVTLPLALPSIMSAFILVLIMGLGAFETAVLMGMPGGFYVFISRIYEAIELRFNPGLATAYASVLITLTVSLVGVYVWTTRKAGKYATVIGKGFNPRTIKLGRWRYIALLGILAYFLFALIIPYGVVTITSFIPYFTYETFKNFLGVFTLNNYVRVFGHPTFARGIVNSLMLGLSAAAITIPICTIWRM